MSNLSSENLLRLFRYYQVGLINTAFGYATYAMLVAVGLNLFVAQIFAHVINVTFNYFSYSRHVFRDAAAPKTRFILSYVANYFVSLACLAAAARIFESPYVAGLAALLVASLVNFLVLRSLVFTRPGGVAQ